MSIDTTPDEPDYAVTPTRPKTAPRQQSRQAGGPRKVSRYTLDLEQNQHQFMKLFATHNNVSGSKIMRTMLYFLESDTEFADRVLNEVFAEDGNATDSEEPTDETDPVS